MFGCAEEIAEAPEVEVVELSAVFEHAEAAKEEDADVVVVAEVAAEEVAASGPFVGWGCLTGESRSWFEILGKAAPLV